jgi:hypothetical protein
VGSIDQHDNPRAIVKHVLKDPTPNASTTANHRIVLIEGLYTLLSIDPWYEAAALSDERWLPAVDVESVKARLAKRRITSGIVGNRDELCGRPRIVTFQVRSLEVLLFFYLKFYMQMGILF